MRMTWRPAGIELTLSAAAEAGHKSKSDHKAFVVASEATKTSRCASRTGTRSARWTAESGATASLQHLIDVQRQMRLIGTTLEASWHKAATLNSEVSMRRVRAFRSCAGDAVLPVDGPRTETSSLRESIRINSEAQAALT